jgi:hypothetical protein
MNMQVWHGLAGSLLIIESDVETLWRILFFNRRLGLLDGGCQGGLFLGGGVEPACDVTVGYISLCSNLYIFNGATWCRYGQTIFFHSFNMEFDSLTYFNFGFFDRRAGRNTAREIWYVS